MRFLKCFWIPMSQAWVVFVCFMTIVIPTTWLGILVKSMGILLFSFFAIAIASGGFSIYREQQKQLKFQRESVARERDIRVLILMHSNRKYQLQATTLNGVILFDQPFHRLSALQKELSCWKKENPTLNCDIKQEVVSIFSEEGRN